MSARNLAGAAAVAVVIASAGVLAGGQGTGPRLSAPGSAWEEWRTRTPPASAAEQARARQANEAADERAAAERAASRRGAAAGERAVDSASRIVAQAFGFRESADEALRAFEREAGERGHGRASRAARELREAAERSGLLDESDEGMEPEGAPDGQPDVPASCEGNPACGECYGTAMDGLDDTRYRLERLRAIYASTVSDAKAKVAFADGASNIHGVSALAWQKYRVGIMDSLKRLDRAYDEKYAELMKTLLADLQGISGCEERIMRVPDWYDRFGFIYYTFMKDRYKRPAL